MKSPLRSDSRLVTQVLRGRPDRFEPLVRRYLPAVRAVAYGRLRNVADTDDIAQETFVRAYEKLGNLRDRDKFGSWLLSIARHAALRASERRHREAPLEPRHAEAAEADTPDLARRQQAAIVREHLAELPEPARDVLLLHYFAGHSTREIAELLELSQAAVLKRLQRAREQLGASLLTDLADDLPATADVAKHAARISALAAASAIHSATGVGSVTTAATGVPMLVKGVAAVAAAAALSSAAMLFAVSTPSNPSESATQPAPPNVTTPERDVPAIQGPDTEPPGEHIVVAAATNAEPTAEETATAEPSAETTSDSVESEAADEPASLTGLWQLRIGDDQSGVLLDYGTVTMTQSGFQVEAELTDPRGQEVFQSTGTLSGSRLTMQLYAEGTVFTPVGDVAADGDRITLRADALDLVDEFPSGTIRFELERADEAVSDRHTLEAAYRDEVQAMFDALRTWRDEHDGVYPDPKTAESVYRAVLPDDDTRRRIGYNAVPTTLTPPEHLPAAHELPTDTTFYPDLPLPDRLVLLERALEEAWDGGLSTLLEPVLTVRYPDAKLAFDAYDAEGVVDVSREDNNEPIPLAQHAALRATCANNMKQLGLAAKMFANEVVSYYPPGFNVLYPRQLVDPQILRCPTASDGVVSYELLFPAYSHDYLLAIAADYHGVAVEDLPQGSWGAGGIPFMIETHDCAGREGAGLRHVLFLDGHVETMKPEDFEERVVPFFDYR